MRTYDEWRNEILARLDARKINYGYIGDCITCVDDYGRTLGGADLKGLWKDKRFPSEVVDIITANIEA